MVELPDDNQSISGLNRLAPEGGISLVKANRARLGPEGMEACEPSAEAWSECK